MSASTFTLIDLTRVGQTWRIRLKCSEWEHVGQIISANPRPTGIPLATRRPFFLGTPVELVIELPDGLAYTAKGTICSVPPSQGAVGGAAAGIGVRIELANVSELRHLENAALLAPVDEDRAGEHLLRAEPDSAAPIPGLKPPTGQISAIAGIDFGTSYSSISVAIGDRVYLLPDAQGRTQQPSVVSFPEGEPVAMGWPARSMLALDPRRTASSIKRLLARQLDDVSVEAFVQSAAFPIVPGADGAACVKIDDTAYSTQQLAAAIIGYVRDLGQRFIEQPIRQAVFTVPASFGEPQLRGLRRAAEIARISVAELLPEPVAGALAYGIGQGKNEIVAVYDFGGGTFDFSVVDMAGDHYRVLGVAGDAWLGGDDFDVAMGSALADVFWRATKIELRSRQVEWQRLLFACERAKRELSASPTSMISVDAIVETPQRIDIRQPIDRGGLERTCHQLLERSLAVCQEALDKVGLGPEDMTAVVLTGGISRIPFIQEGVARFFGREIQTTVDPDQAVALGAGLRAAQLAQHEVRGCGRVGPH